MTSEPLDPDCPLGVVCEMLRMDGEAQGHPGMLAAADICSRRIHDKDEDMARLTRAYLFQYAKARGIDVTKMGTPRRSH